MLLSLLTTAALGAPGLHTIPSASSIRDKDTVCLIEYIESILGLRVNIKRPLDIVSLSLRYLIGLPLACPMHYAGPLVSPRPVQINLS